MSATPCFAVDKIYSPYVEQGEVAFEYSGNRTFDNNHDKNNVQEHQFAVEYGVNSWWQTEGYGNFEKQPDESFKMSGIEWENRFQFTERGAHWLDTGLLVAYEHAIQKGNPDGIEIKALLAKDTGKFSHLANIGFSQEVGSHAAGGPDYAFLWSTRYRYSEYAQPGFEVQSDLGAGQALQHFDQQEHFVGPALYGRLFGHLKYEAAYLVGVSDASSNSAVRGLLEYEMHF
jgi:hypothetical protein